ncbi:sn-glycerol-1-phosphate dehydrogenase [Cohnella algarum]|uniref:sn-glycerol-1-phosphate dehydrogenase n=1 Tax=Cohnella algarum TaxID=2044859 RepID=UPI0019682498|nr:sn-glycerol-1-phosphate dehydrogenase [Cohnella algarum]MBN2980884.1 sn-glycerol-1-phosphate dehydrogenase [Cohnella algarum]
MNGIKEKIAAAARQLGNEATVGFPEAVVVEAGAQSRVAPFMKERGYGRPLLVADEHTLAAAGRTVAAGLAGAGFPENATLVKPNAQGDVVADEASIVQVILDLQKSGADAIVVAGSGTLHDIARYAAYTTRLPFVSVPTAASVDGFASRGAPILIRGEKITVQAIGPTAIFADLAVMSRAPAALTAAGFADMLGKYTSLFDWKFGSLTAGEPYNEAVAGITEQALRDCVEHADLIGRRTEDGIRVLTEALIDSGLAMLVFGQSHPASGAEHHLSHYWEMEYIRTGKRQLLHGAKVGAACAEIAGLYRGLEMGEYAPNEAAAAELRGALRDIPDPDALRGLLRRVGGPSSVSELGVSGELLARSLREAHRVRPNRFTLLRAYNEKKAAGQQKPVR